MDVECGRGEHPVQIQLRAWDDWQIVHNPCLKARLAPALAPCVRAIQRRDPVVQLSVVHSLSEIHTEAALRLLLDAAASETHAHPLLQTIFQDAVRRGVYLTVPALDVAAIPILTDALESPHRAVRQASCHGLSMLADDPRAQAALERATRDPSALVRVQAWRGLATPEAVPALIELLNDLSAEVRRAACYALGWLEDPRAIPALSHALNDPDASVRAAAQDALNELQKSDNGV